MSVSRPKCICKRFCSKLKKLGGTRGNNYIFKSILILFLHLPIIQKRRFLWLLSETSISTVQYWKTTKKKFTGHYKHKILIKNTDLIICINTWQGRLQQSRPSLRTTSWLEGALGWLTGISEKVFVKAKGKKTPAKQAIIEVN